ncbi:MAG: hypothetical protein PSV36_04515 [Algoriphagus sp.]|nr:hypothetical protein [Algoriphagus sp.]
MKNRTLVNRLGSFLLVFAAVIWLAPQKATANTPNGVSFQVFYDELAPYGDWVKDVRYGYIWLPAVDQSFHPYSSDGHWVMTEYGNTWVSYYDWGWAPFHYGRWIHEDFYGWAWIPDYEWGPAWVDWRSGGGYYGWAPMAPSYYNYSMINRPSFFWVFVPQNRFMYHHVNRYHAHHKYYGRIYNNTTIINNTVVYDNNTYSAGPQRRELERVTRKVVPVYQVNNSVNAGRNALTRNSLEVYRPEVQASRGTAETARPSRFLSAEEVKTSRTQERSGTAESAQRTPSRLETQGSRSESPEVRFGETPARTSSPIRSEYQSTRPSSSESGNEGFSTRPVPNQERTTSPQRSTPSRSTVGTSPAVRTQERPAVRPSGNEWGNSDSRVAQPSRSVAPARTESSPRVSPAPTRSTNSTAPAPATRSTNNAPSRSGSPARGN